MIIQKLKYKLIFPLFIFGLFLPFSFAWAGTITSPYKYAWSDQVGYINFAPVQGGVTVTSSTLSGHAWSENNGYINFAPAQGGVFNDGAGHLSGSAWGEGLGYIDFSGVSINTTTGKFSGTATGTLIGTLTFDCPTYCDVRTDWRPATVTTPAVGRVGGGSFSAPTPTLSSEELTKATQAAIIDIQKDGIINILDFNTMMVNWGSVQNLALVLGAFNPADMNHDGIVDIFDFNLLMVYWGTVYKL